MVRPLMCASYRKNEQRQAHEHCWSAMDDGAENRRVRGCVSKGVYGPPLPRKFAYIFFDQARASGRRRGRGRKRNAFYFCSSFSSVSAVDASSSPSPSSFFGLADVFNCHQTKHTTTISLARHEDRIADDFVSLVSRRATARVGKHCREKTYQDEVVVGVNAEVGSNRHRTLCKVFDL